MTERVTAPAAFAALHDIVSAGDEPPGDGLVAEVAVEARRGEQLEHVW